MTRPLRSSSIASLGATRELPAAARGSFNRRWCFFFIAELNGLADQRRLAIEERDGTRVLAVQSRIRQILGSLAWEPAAALLGAYEFARDKIDYPEDAWGPALVVGALEPDHERFARWLGSLNTETQRELGGLNKLLAIVSPGFSRVVPGPTS